MKRLLKRIINSFGFQITRLRRVNGSYLAPEDKFPADFTDAEISTILRVRPFTITSPERIVAAIRAAEYVAINQIPGSIVECGVWRGGSMMAIAITLLRLNKGTIPLYLFDTYEGMSEPVVIDGEATLQKWRSCQGPIHNEWCFASLDDVQRNMESTGYDKNMAFYIKGKVEDTIPGAAPAQISLLRLDTDWYESTKHDLEHLFPRLSPGGVLLIDDYGHWQGCRKAVDEYVERNKVKVLLNRIDYTGRIGIKL